MHKVRPFGLTEPNPHCPAPRPPAPALSAERSGRLAFEFQRQVHEFISVAEAEALGDEVVGAGAPQRPPGPAPTPIPGARLLRGPCLGKFAVPGAALCRPICQEQ